MNERTNERTNERMNEWMNEWMKEGVSEWVNEWIISLFRFYKQTDNNNKKYTYPLNGHFDLYSNQLIHLCWHKFF